MTDILNRKFFKRPVLEVAPELPGCFLVVRQAKGVVERYKITEVEAYDGEQDLACHASRGRTARTEAMYQPGGVFYVYLVYGLYYMLNIVTGPADYPAAVLIRGLESISGPGRLTRRLGLDQELNFKAANRQTGVWFESAESQFESPRKILTTPRVGVDYAGLWAEKPYRFVLTE